MTSPTPPDGGSMGEASEPTPVPPPDADELARRLFFPGSLEPHKPWPHGEVPALPVKPKPEPEHTGEFKSRQELADFVYGVPVTNLVTDGFSLNDMPPWDREIQTAFLALEEAQHAVEAAVAYFLSLLPDSSFKRNKED